MTTREELELELEDAELAQDDLREQLRPQHRCTKQAARLQDSISHNWWKMQRLRFQIGEDEQGL